MCRERTLRRAEDAARKRKKRKTETENRTRIVSDSFSPFFFLPFSPSPLFASHATPVFCHAPLHSPLSFRARMPAASGIYMSRVSCVFLISFLRAARLSCNCFSSVFCLCPLSFLSLFFALTPASPPSLSRMPLCDRISLLLCTNPASLSFSLLSVFFVFVSFLCSRVERVAATGLPHSQQSLRPPAPDCTF